MIASIFDVLSKMLMQPSRVHVSQDQKHLIYNCCLCALYNHVDNIFIRFGSRLYSQIVGKIMGTECALLMSFCNEREFTCLTIIKAFHST